MGISYLSFPLSFCFNFMVCLLRRLGEFAMGLDAWWEAVMTFYLAQEHQSGSWESVDGESIGDPHDLLHYKMGCWFLPSLWFASFHLRPQWSQLGQCFHPPVGGPQWWLWQSTTQSSMNALWTRLFTHTTIGEAGRKSQPLTYLITLGSDFPIMDLSQQFWSIKRKLNIYISSSKNIVEIHKPCNISLCVSKRFYLCHITYSLYISGGDKYKWISDNFSMTQFPHPKSGANNRTYHMRRWLQFNDIMHVNI